MTTKYIIHACEERLKYVENYLIPSMIEQGISDSAIELCCDDYHIGNLSRCMEIFSTMTGDGGAWHLQDEIVICRKFKEITESYDDGKTIVCGFVWDKDVNVDYVGYVEPQYMWTFPCIYIPNHMARGCAEWFYNKASKDPKYKLWVMENRYDDYFFQEYIKTYYPTIEVLNLKPNLVDHIDYLLGGTLVDKWRKDYQVRAAWFEDLDLVEELERKMNEDNYGK